MPMFIHFSLLAFLLLLLLLLLPVISTHSTKKHIMPPKHDLVRTSCVRASYPNICLRTLSSYSGPINTPRDLAQAAVKVSLSRARKASVFLSHLKSHSKREEGVLNDCVEQMGDSVDELSETLEELHNLHGGDFQWRMSNAQTWVSAALTNEDTCLDGFKDIVGNIRSDVKKKVTNLARITSNALYLINLLDESRGKRTVQT